MAALSVSEMPFRADSSEAEFYAVDHTIPSWDSGRGARPLARGCVGRDHLPRVQYQPIALCSNSRAEPRRAHRSGRHAQLISRPMAGVSNLRYVEAHRITGITETSLELRQGVSAQQEAAQRGWCPNDRGSQRHWQGGPLGAERRSSAERLIGPAMNAH